MDVWDKSMLDLVERAHVVFDADGMGSIGFIAVRGGIDYRIVDRGGNPAVEFTWEGTDEGDHRSGRAWAVIESDEMHGRLYIHTGDESSFHAKRVS